MSHSLTRPEGPHPHRPRGGRPTGAGTRSGTPDLWQRRAGCGPHHRRRPAGLSLPDPPGSGPPAPPGRGGPARALPSTCRPCGPTSPPGARGLDKPESLVLGCRSFAPVPGLPARMGRSSKSPAGGRTAPLPARLPGLSPPGPGQADCPGGLFWNYSNGSPAQPGTAGTGSPSSPSPRGEEGPPVHRPGRGGGKGHRPGPLAGRPPCWGAPWRRCFLEAPGGGPPARRRDAVPFICSAG